MVEAVAILVALGFASYRAAFHGLPLHMDTGFYVPNAAVAGRGWGVFSGWNSHFSGGSRLLPQLCHTALYRAFGRSYAAAFRWSYAAMVLATALAVALLARRLGLTSPLALWGAPILYLLIASETQYAAYFESAEVFQALFQSWGVLACIIGVADGSVALAGIGIALLWLDAVLIKLTGATTALAVSLAVALALPAAAWLLPLEALLAGAAYLWLLRAAGGRVADRLRYMRRHERYVRRNYPSSLKLALVRFGFAARLMSRNPPIPLLALGGVSLALVERRAAGAAGWLLAAYALAVLTAYAAQGHRVWYYLVPVLPLSAVAAGVGIEALVDRSPSMAFGVVIAAATGSLAINAWPRVRRDPAAFARWVFSVYNRRGGRFGDEMADGDVALVQAAPAIAERVAGEPMLVLGAFNQAYVLIGAAYDTPIVSVCPLAEGTAGDLAAWLANAERDPPRFVLDTETQMERWREVLPWLAGYAEVMTLHGLRLYRREQDE